MLINKLKNIIENEKAAGALLFIATLLIYVKTLCPTLPPRDSGELITAACTLGIAHPPGYPLYVMLGKLFTFIPFGTIAWRVNFMSAFFAAATVTLIYFIIYKLTKNILAAAVSALLLAFSLFFWQYAVVAEVFQLNNFFTALTVFMLLIWREKKDPRWLTALAFIYGLSLSHHHTMILLAPGFIYLIWTTDRSVFRRPKNWLALGGLFCLGLTPYLFLPLRALQQPYLNWGDPSNAARFFAHVTRAQYGTFIMQPGVTGLPTIPKAIATLSVYGGWLLENFIIIGFFLALGGLAVNFARDRRLFVSLVLMFLFTGPLFMLLSGFPFDVSHQIASLSLMITKFTLQSLLFFPIWIGLCLAAVFKRTRRRGQRILALAAALLLPVLSFAAHYRAAEMSRYYYAEDLIGNLLMTVRPNGVLLAFSDTVTFGVMYAQGCENKRPDLTLVQAATPLPWVARQVREKRPELFGQIKTYHDHDAFLVELVKRDAGKVPIYLDQPFSKVVMPFFHLVAPCGLLYEVLGSGNEQARVANFLKYNHLWEKYKFRSPLARAEIHDPVTREFLSFYSESHNVSGLRCLEGNRPDLAESEFKKSLAILPDVDQVISNLKMFNKVFNKRLKLKLRRPPYAQPIRSP